MVNGTEGNLVLRRPRMHIPMSLDFMLWYSPCYRLLEEIGFTYDFYNSEDSVDHRWFDQCLWGFINNLNDKYKILPTISPEEDITIVSLYEPWLKSFLKKALELQQKEAR